MVIGRRSSDIRFNCCIVNINIPRTGASAEIYNRINCDTSVVTNIFSCYFIVNRGSERTLSLVEAAFLIQICTADYSTVSINTCEQNKIFCKHGLGSDICISDSNIISSCVSIIDIFVHLHRSLLNGTCKYQTEARLLITSTICIERKLFSQSGIYSKEVILNIYIKHSSRIINNSISQEVTTKYFVSPSCIICPSTRV